jgi:hypothetical protein
LEEVGFDDIEQIDERKEDYFLKSWDSSHFQLRFTPDTFRDAQDYYYYSEHFLQCHKFRNDVERDIWRLHIEGKSLRDISADILENRSRHSKFCREYRCDLFCPVAQATEAARNFTVNKDKVGEIIRLLKLELKKFLGGALEPSREDTYSINEA